MTLKSALQDVKETTLAAVAGLLGKLAYLASLRGAQGRYEHWGLEAVHGPESSERALKDGPRGGGDGSFAGAPGVAGEGLAAIQPGQRSYGAHVCAEVARAFRRFIAG